MLNVPYLPDPYDTPWDECLSVYRAERQSVLWRLKASQASLTQYQQAGIEMEARGGPTKEERSEMTNRVQVLAMNSAIGQQYLVILRDWLWLARAVHGMTSMREYEAMRLAQQAGVPRSEARRLYAAYNKVLDDNGIRKPDGTIDKEKGDLFFSLFSNPKIRAVVIRAGVVPDNEDPEPETRH